MFSLTGLAKAKLFQAFSVKFTLIFFNQYFASICIIFTCADHDVERLSYHTHEKKLR